MALEHGTQCRRTWLRELARRGSSSPWRRHDLDDRHLRSRLALDLLGNRQSQSSARGRRAEGRQFVDLLDRRVEYRHWKARMGLSGFAARYARLGRYTDTHFV